MRIMPTVLSAGVFAFAFAAALPVSDTAAAQPGYPAIQLAQATNQSGSDVQGANPGDYSSQQSEDSKHKKVAPQPNSKVQGAGPDSYSAHQSQNPPHKNVGRKSKSHITGAGQGSYPSKQPENPPAKATGQ